MFVKKLLASPVCQLPCWWGIRPGQSLWSEAANFLQGIGSKTGIDTTKGETIVYGTGGFDFSAISTYNRIDFYESTGVIEAITIDVEGYYNPEAFRQVWAEYSPEKVVGAYGQPSRVWVQSISTVHEGPIGSTMPYDLWLFYDTDGFLVRYGGTVKYATTYTFCPTFTGSDSTLHTLNMVLQSPTSTIALETINDFLRNSTRGVRPLQEVTDLNTDGFHELLVEETIQPCFTTPRDVWP